MFNRLQKVYQTYRPVKDTDKYNQETISWDELGTVKAFISLNSHAVPAVNNAYYAQQCEYLGVTSFASSQDLQIGDRVDKYEIIFIVDAGSQRFLYLKDYGRSDS